jgi:outer membrane protein assembly factor BamE
MCASESGLKLSYDNAFAARVRSSDVNALRLIPFVLALTACTSVNVPLSPYRIDVQQGNALGQEAVDKLKVGMTRSQVRFLLGTPMLVDPFHGSRWDYVYTYRASGKLTEEKRLTLVFNGDILASIEGEGVAAAGGTTKGNAIAQSVLASAPATAIAPAGAESAPKQAPISSAATAQPSTDKLAEPAIRDTSSANTLSSQQRADLSLNETSIVPPLKPPKGQPAAKVPSKPAAVTDRPPEPVALQAESNVASVKPDQMPSFSDAAQPMEAAEKQVMTAMNAWAQAWRAKDVDAYIAAYAPGFRPQGGSSRAEWERRRSLLLGLSRNIDLKIDSASVEIQGEKKALVTFNQFYTSDTYQDAVIKQLRFVLANGHWLIEEEAVLGPLKIKK